MFTVCCSLLRPKQYLSFVSVALANRRFRCNERMTDFGTHTLDKRSGGCAAAVIGLNSESVDPAQA